MKLPAMDRIYTITEGNGITSALCDGQPCAEPKAADTEAGSALDPCSNLVVQNCGFALRSS